jgi:hypothetical protein
MPFSRLAGEIQAHHMKHNASVMQRLNSPRTPIDGVAKELVLAGSDSPAKLRLLK